MNILILLFLCCLLFLRSTTDDTSIGMSPANKMLQAEVVKAYRKFIARIGVFCVVSYHNTADISRVLNALDKVSRHSLWKVRQATAHFLLCCLFNARSLSRLTTPF